MLDMLLVLFAITAAAVSPVLIVQLGMMNVALVILMEFRIRRGQEEDVADVVLALSTVAATVIALLGQHPLPWRQKLGLWVAYALFITANRLVRRTAWHDDPPVPRDVMLRTVPVQPGRIVRDNHRRRLVEVVMVKNNSMVVIPYLWWRSPRVRSLVSIIIGLVVFVATRVYL